MPQYMELLIYLTALSMLLLPLYVYSKRLNKPNATVLPFKRPAQVIQLPIRKSAKILVFKPRSTRDH